MAIKTFTAGEVLTAADTNTYLANSGLVYIKQQTIGSAVASVTVSDAFSTTYDNYKIVISGGLASGLTTLVLTLGASVTGYSSGTFYVSYGSTTPLAASDNASSSFGYAGYATTGFIAFNLDVVNPFLAKPTVFGPTNWAAGTVAGTGTGIHNVATSYTAFTIATSSGTLTGGTIFVYGYRKA
jgi:hypothetical protein